jgi:hypothetical protein
LPAKKERKPSRNPTGRPIRVCRHDGKEARRKGKNMAGQSEVGMSRRDGGSPASSNTVKVTLHLSVGTAQRLGVESAMRRISQSAIAEEVLSAYLSRWNLPEVAESGGPGAA